MAPRSPAASFSHGLVASESMSSDLDGTAVGVDGLGSLADELADDWDEEDEGADEMELEAPSSTSRRDGHDGHPRPPRDSGVDVASSPGGKDDDDGMRTPSPTAHRPTHRRKVSMYDGSDYGNESDEERSGISASLEARLAAIESLARRGTESNGIKTDDVVDRVVRSLKDLGPQSNLENGATRLITSHTALSTHLAHQTRTLHSLAFTLLSPLSPPPSSEQITTLLPLVTGALSSIPQPTSAALSSLSHLSTHTADLISTLDHLSDTLHMSRQTTTAATRKLKTARELVDALRRENDAIDEGIRWIERGDWQTRLAQRECGGVCRDVVGGFEEVCQGWRTALLASASSASAGAGSAVGSSVPATPGAAEIGAA
ncbi:MAG: hypothetical protein M1838_000104 [Thelocarpon superellum]|nr:MAG: hypothetical protein M1838_000104 [Thelocarpon superellum]